MPYVSSSTQVVGQQAKTDFFSRILIQSKQSRLEQRMQLRPVESKMSNPDRSSQIEQGSQYPHLILPRYHDLSYSGILTQPV